MLGGRYRLEEELGAGGMAVVWRAHDPVLGRAVAVKLLAPDIALDAEAIERIHAEARAVARLAHPNIGTVYDFGESAGQPYVVMELLDGETLDERLDSEPLPWQEALTVCAEVAAGLAAAHARGVVHQDIKPANVILTATGAKIVDFGIAVSDPTPDSRDDDPVLGTLRYAAPERLLGGLVGPAADVYALGLVLYRCLTGELPWRGTTTDQIASNHCYVMPRPLPPIEGLPPSVADLVAQCLAKRPEDRPSSREVARELAAAAGIRSTLQPLPVHSGATLRHAVPLPQAPRSRPRPARIAVAALVVVGVALAVAVWAGNAARDGGAAFAVAPTGAPGLGQAGFACRVWFTPNGNSVQLTVENTGSATFVKWTLMFTTNDRYFAGSDTVLAQSGSRVTVRGPGDRDLPVGRWTTVRLTRSGTGAPPSGYAVNNTICAAIAGNEQPAPSGRPVDPDDELPGGTPPPAGAIPPELTAGPPDATPSIPDPTTGPPTTTTPPQTGPPASVPSQPRPQPQPTPCGTAGQRMPPRGGCATSM